jgi:hypothetical protein
MHYYAHKNKQRGNLIDSERYQLGTEGRAYIRAHNNADRLGQIHHSGVDEADRHDSCRCRAVNGDCRRNPDRDR